MWSPRWVRGTSGGGEPAVCFPSSPVGGLSADWSCSLCEPPDWILSPLRHNGDTWHLAQPTQGTADRWFGSQRDRPTSVRIKLWGLIWTWRSSAAQVLVCWFHDVFRCVLSVQEVTASPRVSASDWSDLFPVCRSFPESMQDFHLCFDCKPVWTSPTFSTASHRTIDDGTWYFFFFFSPSDRLNSLTPCLYPIKPTGVPAGVSSVQYHHHQSLKWVYLSQMLTCHHQ